MATKYYLAGADAFMNTDKEFWEAIDKLAASGDIVIDRPKGSRHPRYADIVYELDYGYVCGTESMDGAGVDVWRGSLADASVSAIIVTVDLAKRDSEIKLLIGCTEDEMESVYKFHNRTELMKGLLIKR